ncbi:MAG: D-alanyl-D-alanine carboxypeptidase/D-alanyl-D-alanine-endopeptidase [Methylobacillus sp.]|nr:D-alanyl-D-alanine carboxypeptidase/D-alanyl-D-alanine-endopeptidase [Methylobacillus sp.]
MMRYALFFLTFFACAAQAALPEPVAQALKTAGIPQDAVAVYARRVDAKLPALAEHSEQAMIPASVMKLVTTYAGLEMLGPAYVWRTEFRAAQTPVKGVLTGDLVLKGYGDPALTLEKFWMLVHTLRVSGVREIRGNLVLDRSYFEPMPAFNPGAFDGDTYRPYNAGPDALLINFKATDFHFSVEDGAVNVTADPVAPKLEIVNRLKADRAACGDWKNRMSYDVRQGEDKLTITFSGNYSEKCNEQVYHLSLQRYADYVFQLFTTMWRGEGGVFEGKLREGVAPADAPVLASVESPPLADVIRLINKYSNNLMARQLLITLGAEKGQGGSAAKGSVAARAWLAANGLDFPELVLENGSGLSRNERISAKHLGDLLAAAYASPFMSEYMSSLPIYAVDGTFKKRSQSNGAAGRAHLKSGTLDGVSAAAGYLLDARGRLWIVVFIANHPRAEAGKAAQDALLDWLYNYSE